MEPLGDIDPVLALLDHLHDLRRSWWRRWTIGGPAAVDALSVGASSLTAAVRLVMECDRVPLLREPRHLHPLTWGRARDILPRDQQCPAHGAMRRRIWEQYQERYREGYEKALQRFRDLAAEMDDWPNLRARLQVEGINQLDWAPRSPCQCAEASPVAALIRKALGTPEQHAVFCAPTTAELWPQLARVPELPEDVFQGAYSAGESMVAARPSFPLFQVTDWRLQAQLAQIGTVSVRLGHLTGRFWAAGTRHHCRKAMLGLPDAVMAGNWKRWLVTCLLALSGGFWLALGASVGSVRVILAALPWAGVAIHACDTASARRRAGVLRQIRQGRRAQPDPLVVITGPDAATSWLFHSLFAHLASHAALADPAQGGTVLDDGYVELSDLLAADAPPPRWSSTYRMRFGEGMPAPPHARFVHMVLPPGGRPDALCERILGRAAQVWVVVPRGWPAEEAEAYRAQIGGEAAVVIHDAPGVESALAEAGAHPAPALATDLQGVRERYLAGGVPAGEAADVVRRLMALPSAPASVTGEAAQEREARGQAGCERQA